jgi:hypothetical protein
MTVADYSQVHQIYSDALHAFPEGSLLVFYDEVYVCVHNMWKQVH